MMNVGSLSLQTTFAVPLHCDSCIKDVSGAVKALNGMCSTETDVKHSSDLLCQVLRRSKQI